jgi:phosphoribosylanthranilate isomerase
VDVSSGVEYADRKGKDPAKVASFIQAVEKEDLRESL